MSNKIKIEIGIAEPLRQIKNISISIHEIIGKKIIITIIKHEKHYIQCYIQIPIWWRYSQTTATSLAKCIIIVQSKLSIELQGIKNNGVFSEGLAEIEE